MKIQLLVSKHVRGWAVRVQEQWVQHREDEHPALFWDDGDKEYYRWGNYNLTYYKDV